MHDNDTNFRLQAPKPLIVFGKCSSAKDERITYFQGQLPSQWMY